MVLKLKIIIKLTHLFLLERQKLNNLLENRKLIVYTIHDSFLVLFVYTRMSKTILISEFEEKIIITHENVKH